MGVPPFFIPGARVGRQRPRSKSSEKGEWWLPPEKNLNRHFEKFIACMVLKLTVYVRNANAISFFYKPKPG